MTRLMARLIAASDSNCQDTTPTRVAAAYDATSTAVGASRASGQ
jgi:hypothetical protein